MFESSLKLLLCLPNWFNAIQVLEIFPFLLGLLKSFLFVQLICFKNIKHVIGFLYQQLSHISYNLLYIDFNTNN